MPDKCFICQYEINSKIFECVYMGLTSVNQYGYATFDNPLSGFVMHRECFIDMAGKEYMASLDGQKHYIETADRRAWLKDHIYKPNFKK